MKHKLKVKYYIRYVDDFVILYSNKERLLRYKEEINIFLEKKLKLTLHPEKSMVIQLGNRLSFLGFRIFYYHRLLKKSNLQKMKNKFKALREQYRISKINYDVVYNFLEGWLAYAKNANTFKLRRKLAKKLGFDFSNQISTKEINRMTRHL